MTQPADPAEVAAANLAGRLHPSQRPMLIGWWFWARLAVAGVFAVLLIVLPLTTGVLDSEHRGQTLGAAPFAVLLIVACVVSCVRSYQNLSRPLQVITGWTHNFEKDGMSHAYPICVRHYFARVSHWEMVAGGKSYDISKSTFERLQPDRNNTVVLIPRSKVVVNIFPA
ncbi:hypothetical protein GCM10022222_50420 [Amycolatopsis ultiminotia]|uniref:PH domain-containing protein n=1 Tax=Amycolatopsis ultiminotia TaxID=543629 RepID=A0ABP6X503_9PSEU